MSQIELTQSYVTYQAQTKLLELGIDLCDGRLRLSRPELREKFNQAVKIRLWLKALSYSDYLEKEQIDLLVYCLADLCDANAIPYAPVVSSVSRPSILVGGTTNIINNYYTDATDFSNPDVDIGTEDLDTFAATLARGAVWHYTIRDQAGVNQRSGIVVASWLASGSSIVYTEESTADIGTTIGVVTLSVDYSSPNIRLRATSTSNNWICEGTRYLING